MNLLTSGSSSVSTITSAKSQPSLRCCSFKGCTICSCEGSLRWKYKVFFVHRTGVKDEDFSSRNTTGIFMCAAYMNIETLIVINKCLRCTKIPLLCHLKTIFPTKTWKNAPHRRPLDILSKLHDNPVVLSHFRVYLDV